MDTTDETQDEQAMAEREERAGHALEAYRERRRRRRGEDTYFGSADCLLTHDDGSLEDEAERLRRRMDVVDEAQDAGMSPELAEMVYDVAREEGLDPPLAYELVRSGLGVAPPADGIDNAAAQPATDKYYPTWLLPAAPPDDVLRERMLRMSFRRMRAKLEEHERPDEAFRAYAREPDVGMYGF
ncbi:MAG TPA: hypothetical protein VFJ16_15725 [Longimicrobium sp.]|nr:hypothetical protein [Longimicrobium sp.]